MTIVSTKFGRMRILDADNVVSRSLATYGEWADEELQLLRKLIDPGFVVMDAGAFIGTHTIAFSNFVGHRGKVFSFEPRKELFSVLLENLVINESHNVSAFNMGLADARALMKLRAIDIEQSDNFGGLSLADDLPTSVCNAYDAEISTVDAFKFNKLDLIKLDVEGMEGKILDGSLDSISRCQPIVFCECNSLNSGKELLDFSDEQNYKSFGFLSSAYNPNNFNRNEENIFRNAKELSLLMIPTRRVDMTVSKLGDVKLLPVNSVEDLVLPLLHKPQYVYEVLSNTPANFLLGLNFPSPLADAREGETALLHREISRIKSSASWQMTKPLRLLQSIWSSIITDSAKR